MFFCSHLFVFLIVFQMNVKDLNNDMSNFIYSTYVSHCTNYGKRLELKPQDKCQNVGLKVNQSSVGQRYQLGWIDQVP
jgi:hypothetical protein